ncbi:MAG: hypothetical protein DRH93_18555 [Deltaproteobacteria bacterium]|nr:MAG: hypothetical protein DRH93_18555 [Deltaproteobacteria bacterium]
MKIKTRLVITILRAYLKCALLCHGFARARCTCDHEFSAANHQNQIRKNTTIPSFRTKNIIEFPILVLCYTG